MENLVNLLKYGQSYWLDNLTRKKIKDGEIKKRVTEKGLRGITSNPSIFNKAFTAGNEYDNQIEALAKEGKTTQEIYEALTIKDVQDACDILKPVYEQSQGTDGFVSLEVSPFLARDTQGSMNEARRLYKSVNRVNCYIKIPGTKEGVPAIEEMLYEGININITLLFSIENYEAVADAYIRALKRRHAEGKSLLNTSSVASFFLSRIDVLCDQLLSHYLIPSNSLNTDFRPDLLFGKTGIASAKLAYQRFKEIFSGKDWEELKENGAHVQKVLWASTSTKNPLYNDVIYVNSLIGPHTVNTLPEETIDAFADHGLLKENTIEDNLTESKQLFTKLKEVGIDIHFVTQQLENEGIQKFIESYNTLMSGLAEKRMKALINELSTQQIAFGDLEKAMKATAAALDEKQAGRRLFKQDPFLWKRNKEQVKDISERLGWLILPEDSLKKVGDLHAFTRQIQSEQYKHVVLLGMGGSSLCSEVVKDTFKTKKDYLELLILDNVAPKAVVAIGEQINLEKTLFIVASKSGTTTETLSFFNYFYEEVKKAGIENPGNNFIAITDKGTPLTKVAEQHGFRRTFLNPPDLGGRYSVLSDFGLVPMALMGVDIEAILLNAKQMKASCDPSILTLDNPGIVLGAFLGVAQKHGRDKVTFVTSSSINSFGLWLEQLLAESTGKEGKGLIPVNGEMLGDTEVYGNDRIFVHLYMDADDYSEDEKKLKALEESGHPIIRIKLNNKIDLGGEFYRWEIAVAIAGIVLDINPFDQPNVEESKKNTKEILQNRMSDGSFKDDNPIIKAGDHSINSFISQAKPNDYIALLPYFLMTPARKTMLQSWRLKMRDELKVATTLLEGPRYLHSTGQLHKGGPDSGIYIILTDENEKELGIPGQDYGFATLDQAEALGDFQALANKKRRVQYVQLGKDIDAGLKKLKES